MGSKKFTAAFYLLLNDFSHIAVFLYFSSSEVKSLVYFLYYSFLMLSIKPSIISYPVWWDSLSLGQPWPLKGSDLMGGS